MGEACQSCGHEKPIGRHGNSNVCSDECKREWKSKYLLTNAQSIRDKRIAYETRTADYQKKRRQSYEKANRKRINARIVERRIKQNAALAALTELGIMNEVTS